MNTTLAKYGFYTHLRVIIEESKNSAVSIIIIIFIITFLELQVYNYFYTTKGLNIAYLPI